jgi:hypothetical protein
VSVAHAYNSSFLGNIDQKDRGSDLNNNQQKMAGRVAQVGEHLPSKYEALSSNPSTKKKKKKKGSY